MTSITNCCIAAAAVIVILFIVFSKTNETKKVINNVADGITRACWSNKMTDFERGKLRELVTQTDKVLKRNNIKWMPTGGSMLSIHRTNKLFLKWDDDYDMTIDGSKVNEAVVALRAGLSEINAVLQLTGDWAGGTLYRICFNDSELGVTRTRNKADLTWPLIDLFTNVPYRKSNFFPYNITPEEIESMEITRVEGIDMTIPTKGNRTYSAFKKNGHIDKCIEQTFSHKRGRDEKCVGEPEKSCKGIDLNY